MKTSRTARSRIPALDLGALALLAAAAIGSAVAPPVAVAAGGMTKLAVKNSGAPVKDLVMDAPEGATYEEKFTNTIVTKGDHFQIMISHGKDDMKAVKKAYAGEESMMKVSKYDVDEPETLLFEGTMFSQTGYHFATNVKIGKVFFKCTDWRKPGGVYTKADAETMLQSCKSLKKK